MFARAAHRLRRAALLARPELIIFLAAAVLTAAGAFTGVQDKLNDLAFLLLKRPASGEIVIVQIDPKSLSQIDTWPWPRSKHAAVLDRLIASGAELVAFDIDFSSPSTARDDALLARSVAAASGRIVLPSFVQHATAGRSPDLVETNPLPALRNGSLIGNSNVFAPNGVAREGSLGLYLPDGRYRQTFAGLVGQRGKALITEFNIDFSIDPATFSKLSYVDVLNGRFDPRAVKGKRVMVGATAIELGDRVPAPLYGVMPGVQHQALIAESILQGRMLLTPGLVGALLLTIVCLLTIKPTHAQWSFKSIGRSVIANVAVLLIGPIALLAATPVMLEAAPALAASVVCLGFVGARELAARARAILRERSTNQMRRAMVELIVEESSDGVVVTDCDGRIELCNERAGHLLNTTRTLLVGRRVGLYMPRFDHMAASHDELQRHGELSIDCGGETITIEVSARRLALRVLQASQDTPIDVYTLRDVTARRKAEEAERRAQDEQLGAERAKSNFIANMSHELRTPLNAIIGFSEMIAKESMGPIGVPKYAEFADLVMKSGRHLLDLINNVLEISRIDANAETLDVETVGFAACAESCVALIHNTRDYKGQTITIRAGDNAAELMADRNLLKHVLINLVSNAVKFSSADGNIAVTSWVQDDGAFGFQVSDDGVGIDPALKPHLTELFYQPDQSFTRRHEGMGLGLYLVKRYLDLMQGALEFDSAPGKGTRVRVVLPGAAVRSTTAAAAA